MQVAFHLWFFLQIMIHLLSFTTSSLLSGGKIEINNSGNDHKSEKLSKIMIKIYSPAPGQWLRSSVFKINCKLNTLSFVSMSLKTFEKESNYYK